MARTINVGVIGTGVGRLHLAGYSKLPDVKILGVCDLDREEAQRFADQYEIPHVFTDYHDLLALDALEGVSIATPNHLHAAMAIDALKAGKHVLVEKPMAMSPAEGKKMIAAAEKADRRLMVGMTLRFERDVQTVYHAVKRGALGKVYYARGSMLRPRAFPGTYPKSHSMARGAWFADKALSGGGPLVDLGVHTFDCTWWLMGRPKPTAVVGRTYSEVAPRFYKKHRVPLDVEDLATAFIKFEDGATMFLDVSWGLNARKEFNVQVMGTRAGVDVSPAIYRDGPEGNFTSEPITLPKNARLEGEWEHFVACIRSARKKCLAPPEDGLTVTQVLAAIYKSAQTNREVKVRTT